MKRKGFGWFVCVVMTTSFGLPKNSCFPSPWNEQRSKRLKGDFGHIGPQGFCFELDTNLFTYHVGKCSIQSIVLLMITICAYRRGCVSADFRHAPWDAKALAGCQWQVKVLRCFTRILAWVWRPNISPSETPFPQLHGRFLFDPSTEKQLD